MKRLLILCGSIHLIGCAEAGTEAASEISEDTPQQPGDQSESEMVSALENRVLELENEVFSLEASINSRSGELNRCKSITRPLARLDCFDEVTAQVIATDEEPVATAETGRGNWIVNIDTNPLDDSRRVTAFLMAEQGTSAFGDPVTFVARCMSNSTEVYINWNDYVGDDSSSVYSEWKHVTVRVGEAAARTERWGVSTDKRATFAPDWAGNLLKEMMQSDRAVFRTIPYGESPVVAIFDTRGMEEALGPLMETCGWEP